MKKNIIIMVMGLVIAILTGACNDRKSYAELLADENQATNAFLADHRVELQIPADSVFEVGENAPYYQIDEDGMIFMQVLNAAQGGVKAETDQLIYFRFMRYSLYNYYKNGELGDGEGNSADLSYGSSSFRFDNMGTQSSYQWGEGLQTPLRFLPLGCEVNLLLKSQKGLYSEISYVVPYLYRIRYFKSQI